MPAAIRSAGISSAIHASARPEELPLTHARAIVDCHAASQRIGASNVSTAPCQSAGNNCANDSNMMTTSREVCVRAVSALKCETDGRRETGAFYRFKSDERSSSGKRRSGGGGGGDRKQAVNRLRASFSTLRGQGPSRPIRALREGFV